MLTIDPGLMVPLAPVGELRKNTIVLRGNLPFTQLQAFEAVVRLGSFKAARTELGGSNVSRHVADLEDRLGRKLLLLPARRAHSRGAAAVRLPDQVIRTDPAADGCHRSEVLRTGIHPCATARGSLCPRQSSFRSDQTITTPRVLHATAVEVLTLSTRAAGRRSKEIFELGEVFPWPHPPAKSLRSWFRMKPRAAAGVYTVGALDRAPGATG
jgi:hypothetical protein